MARVTYTVNSELGFSGLAREVVDCLTDGQSHNVQDIVKMLAAPHGVLNMVVIANPDEVWEAMLFLEKHGHLTLDGDSNSATMTPKGLTKRQNRSSLWNFLFDPVYGTNVSV